MSNSAVVGLLRALLVADTAQFDAAMKRTEASTQAWSKNLKSVGAEATKVGKALTTGLTLPLVGLAAGATKLAIDFESSFAGVRKTVDATEPELAKLSAQFRTLAKEIPISVNEINKLAETAGALGVPKEAIASFVEVMAGLGVATNLTAEEAANAIARIQTIFGAAGKDTDRFASTLVALGNAGASTEKEIVEMAQRIAGAGNSVNLTQAQVLSLASAMSSLGINAEAGGSSMSRILIKMNQAVAEGGPALERWAAAAKTTGAAFREAFEKDAAGALTQVVEGLATAGRNQATIVQGLVGKNTTLLDTFQRLSGAGETLRTTINLGNESWEKNTALTDETSKRYATMESQLLLLWNRIKDVGITLGQALMPVLKLVVDAFDALLPMLEGVIDAFAAMPAPLQLVVIAVGALAAAVGPLMLLFGSLAVGSLGTLITAFSEGGIAVVAFTKALTFLSAHPVVLAITALTALGVAIYGIASAGSDLEKEIRTNTDAFKAETSAIDKALQTYDALATKQGLTAAETKRLREATELLAGASGRSVEQFEKEAKGSDTLTTALQAQLKARRDLLEKQIEMQRAKLSEAQSAVNAAQERRNEVLRGEGTVPTFDDATGGRERAMTLGEQAEAELKLRKEIEALAGAVERERAALMAMTGVKREDIKLVDQKTESTKKGAAASTELAGADEKSAKAAAKQAEALEKAGRAMSEAGVADAIAEMNAQMVIANKYGGIAKAQWQKYTDQIDEWLAAGYKVPPLLGEFYVAHYRLLDTQLKVVTSTKGLVAEYKNVWPAVLKIGDAYREANAAVQGWITNAQKGGGVLKDLLRTPVTLPEPPPPTVWYTYAQNLKAAFLGPNGIFTGITAGLADTLAAGITGAQKFSDGFVAIWKGIKQSLTNILADFLNLFLNQFLKGMLGAILGQQGAWGKAFAGLLSSFGTGAASGVAGGVGTAAGGTAAGAGAGAAGGAGAGAGAGIGMVAVGSLAGAGAGGAAGYYVGYKSGSTTKGVLAGAGTGAAVGAIGGPIGMGVGAGVGALAGWYGAKKAGKDVNNLRDAFMAQAGGWENIVARLEEIGRKDLIQDLGFGPKNVGAMKETIGAIQEVFEIADRAAAELKVKQEAWTKTLTQSFGELGQAASAYGTLLPKAVRESIPALLESKDLTAEMRATLTGMAADPTWKQMAESAKGYGIELSALGGKFQEARITEIALQYARDLKMFSEEGSNMTGVLEGMADELSTIYQDAATSGVALPDTLKPYMQKLIEMGLLVDKNGKKIEDLNEVAFKEVEDVGLTQVVDVLKEIAKLLSEGLPKAAKDGAKGMEDELNKAKPRVKVGVDWDDGGGPTRTTTGSSGESDTPPPEIGLSGGTHGQFIDWGSGTDVTLHGRERVMTAGEAIYGAGLGAINLTVISTLDGKEVARNQVRHLPRALQLAGL